MRASSTRTACGNPWASTSGERRAGQLAVGLLSATPFFGGRFSSLHEIGHSIWKGLNAVLLQQKRDLASMTCAMHRDMQDHLAACHASRRAVRESEIDGLVQLFR